MFPLCLNTSTIRPRSLREKIEAAARAGYDLVELWCADVESYLDDGGTLNALRAQIRAAGLGVPSMIALTDWGDLEGPAFHRYLATTARDRMETAAALDCHVIVATPPTRVPGEFAVLGEHYAALCELGREIGVRPAMEFLGFAPQINTVAAALEIMARSNHPDACTVLDPFHVFRGGGSWSDIRLVPGRAVGICHFNDAPDSTPRERQSDADRVLPGDGALPLGDFVRSLRAIGYHGPVSLELFNRALWERDAAEVAAEGRRKMAAILASA